MITTFYPPYNFGGDGIFVYRLTNELAKRGHKVDVIHCKDSYFLFQTKEPNSHFPNHPNVTIHGLKSKFGFFSPLMTQQTGYPFLKKRKIESILKSKQFDVIHYHNISLIGGLGLLKKRKEITIYTLHEHWLVCPMHVLWKYNRELCVRKSCFLCSLIWKRLPQLWRYSNMVKKSIKNVDCFISPSRFTSKKHEELGLRMPIVHIPHFSPQSNQEISNCEIERTNSPLKPYFLFVGRLEKIKGVQCIIPVFKDYHKAELVIAGDGEYEEALRKMAKGVSNVRFLGCLNYKDLKKLYAEAIAVIIPSICFEVFGMIIIEAFSMKTPVIVNNIGPLPEVINKSGGGLIYNNNNELIKAMDILITKPEKRKELSRKGFNAFKKYWAVENHLKMYFDLISKVYEKKKALKKNEVYH